LADLTHVFLSQVVYPDYYAALLFTRLMGPTVLKVAVTQDPTPSASSPLRAYSHCSREKGKLTVLLINLGPQVSVKLADYLGSAALLEQLQPSDHAVGGHDIYRLEAGPEGRQSHSVRLNGITLELGAQGELPAMPALKSIAASIEMAPLDIVFCVLDAPVTACR
jgi:hypothetical protein